MPTRPETRRKRFPTPFTRKQELAEACKRGKDTYAAVKKAMPGTEGRAGDAMETLRKLGYDARKSGKK